MIILGETVWRVKEFKQAFFDLTGEDLSTIQDFAQDRDIRKHKHLILGLPFTDYSLQLFTETCDLQVTSRWIKENFYLTIVSGTVKQFIQALADCKTLDADLDRTLHLVEQHLCAQGYL